MATQQQDTIEGDRGSRIVRLREYKQSMGKTLASISTHSTKHTLCLHGPVQTMELVEWMQLDRDSKGAVQADSNAATIDSAQWKLKLSTCR